MHEITFLQDLAVVMIVAGLVTIIFHRLHQPVVLGYILAGDQVLLLGKREQLEQAQRLLCYSET